MKAIILSAGRGTRFENSGKTNHKSLLKVGGSTIIERQLKILKELGVDEIMVVIGHESTILKNNLEAYHLSFTYNEFYKETDTLYSLWCAKDFINDDFLCLYADLVFEKEIVLKTWAAKQIWGPHDPHRIGHWGAQKGGFHIGL